MGNLIAETSLCSYQLLFRYCQEVFYVRRIED